MVSYTLVLFANSPATSVVGVFWISRRVLQGRKIVKQLELYEKYQDFYEYKFDELNLGYFEIPKNASTTFRTYLAEYYSTIPPYSANVEKTLLAFQSGGYDMNEFLSTRDEICHMDHIIVLYRHPVSRLKSAYMNIYYQNEESVHVVGDDFIKKPLSYFLDNIFEQKILLDSYADPTTDSHEIWVNHFLPQSWFVPKEIFKRDNARFFNVNEMQEVRNFLKEITPNGFDFGDEKKYNDTEYDKSLLDVDDSIIQEWWRKRFPRDFDFYYKCVEKQRLFNKRGKNDKTS